MFQSILLAYDGSPLARKAAAVGGDIARHYGSTVTVLTAGGQLNPPGPEYVGLSRDELMQRLAEEGQRLVGEQGVEAQIIVRHGDPGGQILQVAGDLRIQLIVLGHRGLGELGLREIIIGSTAMKVVSHAPCMVLVIH